MLHAGAIPGPQQAMVLVGTRLSEVRGFSDFFSEFFTALRRGPSAAAPRMVVLCSRPNYELRAFQVRPRPQAKGWPRQPQICCACGLALVYCCLQSVHHACGRQRPGRPADDCVGLVQAPIQTTA